jgi:hypothetical protein
VIAGLEREQGEEISGVVYGRLSPEQSVIEDYEIGEGRSPDAVGRFCVGGGGSSIPDLARPVGPLTILFDRRPDGLHLRDVYFRPPETSTAPAETRHRVHFRAGDAPASQEAVAEDRPGMKLLWPAAAIVTGLLIGAGAYLLMDRDTPRTAREQPVDPLPAPPPAVEEMPKSAPPTVFEADRSIDPDRPLSRADKAEIQRQVKQTLGRWTESLLRGDVVGHASHYAESVAPYFTKTRVTRDQVEEEIRQMLKRYGSMTTYRISDVTVSVTDGGHAIANFRKRWSTQGRRFAGEEREQLKFAREGGEWRIVSEQELKIYWIRRK